MGCRAWGTLWTRKTSRVRRGHVPVAAWRFNRPCAEECCAARATASPLAENTTFAQAPSEVLSREPHFKPFAWAGLALTGIGVWLSRFSDGESELREVRCELLGGPVRPSAALVDLSIGRPLWRRSWAISRNNCFTVKQLFTCQSCQSRQATTTRGFGRAAFSRCRAVCSPLERPAISGRQSSVRRKKIGLCSPARSVQNHAHRGGGRFGGAMSRKSSVSHSRRSGRQSRRNGGGSRWGLSGIRVTSYG